MIIAYYARCYDYMVILHCFDEIAIIDELSLMFFCMHLYSEYDISFMMRIGLGNVFLL